MLSEFRYCKLTKEWTLFAPHRLKRPNYVSANQDNKLSSLNQNNLCPFDEGNEEYTPNEIASIYQNGKWQCRVVPNLYNALSIECKPESMKESFFEKYSGFGAHEVLIETPKHNKQIWDYDYNDYFNYLTLIQKRLINLKQDIRLAHLSIFKNHGKDAGASMEHAHTQLIGLPFLPKQLSQEIDIKQNYYNTHQRALLDDIVYEESTHKSGIICENTEFLAYCPYASKFPFEVKIVAKKKLSSLKEFNSNDISALSDILKEFYLKFYKTLGDVSFNMIFKNAPYLNYDNTTKKYYRFHINITPRIYNIAGFELDSNIFINVVMPENAAKSYKEL